MVYFFRLSFTRCFIVSFTALLYFIFVFLGRCSISSATNENTKQGYVIVATQSVLEDTDWKKVVDSLKTKSSEQYEVNVIKWDNDVFVQLRNIFPKYVCFVIKPEEATNERLATIWKSTRSLDDDPYGDVIWGIITGYDATDALRLTQVKPMTVETVCGATGISTKYFKSSIVFDESKKNHWRTKKRGEDEKDRNDAPSDTTHSIAEALSESQLFITSGHASENDWSIGYSYKNGFWVAKDGNLIGIPSKESGEEPFLVKATGSKIHIASGNCLWGHIDKPCCMALMMIRHANVDTLIGYVVPTWFGYMGWGIQDYYIEQPGRFTVAEAFYANNQALMYLLVKDAEAREFEHHDKSQSLASDSTNSVSSESSNSNVLSSRTRTGLEYDRDVVVLYGDPAWTNALAPQNSGWNQSLKSEKMDDETTLWTLTIEPQMGKDSFKLSRPIFQLLPQRIGEVKVLEGQEYNPEITDNFILVPLSSSFPIDKSFSIKFSSK